MKKRNKTGQFEETRNQKIVMDALTGKTTTEIAKEAGLCRQRVSAIINHSPEAEGVRALVEDRVRQLTLKALETVEYAMDHREGDLSNALKASLAILDKVTGRMLDKEQQERVIRVIEEVESMTPDELLSNIEEAKRVIEQKSDKKEG